MSLPPPFASLPTLEDVQAARARLQGAIYMTPCPESIPLSEAGGGARLYCKLDYLQRTGSFKERGARNALALLTPEQRARGVITASAGNHALGLAYHGKLLGLTVTVVMPRQAPLIKVTTCQRLGARVLLQGNSLNEARVYARALAERDGAHYVHPYEDPAVIAGQGTMGLEILEQVPDVEFIVLPIGGGGLIAGVGLAVKSLRPDVQIIGVEPENVPSFTAARAAGGPVDIEARPTLADGLAVSCIGELAYAVGAPFVDRVITVSEDELSLAVLRILELEKGVVEGAGASPLAGCLSGKLPELAGKRVVIALCGGNIDPTVLTRVVERGLVADGRLSRFTAVIKDRPGGLAEISQLIASSGANIKEIVHDRVFASSDISAVHVICTVETRDAEHIIELQRILDHHHLEYHFDHPMPHKPH